MGRNCLQEILLHAPHKIKRVMIAQTQKGSQKKDVLISLIEEKKIVHTFMSKDALSAMVHSDSHQSFIAQIDADNFLGMHDLKMRMHNDAFFVALDNIYDPHNFGAILRSCEGFGVDGVIYSKNRGVGITPVVAKTSSGAVAFVPLYEIANLATTLQAMQKEGFEIVTTTCEKNKGVLLQHFKFSSKCVLVMGSEGKGVSSLIEKRADHFISIPMKGNISSFNVSVATSICLFAKEYA